MLPFDGGGEINVPVGYGDTFEVKHKQVDMEIKFDAIPLSGGEKIHDA